MSAAAVIGALHVVLDADNDNFDGAIDHSRSKIAEMEASIGSLGDKLREIGSKIAGVGIGIATAFNASMAAISATSLHTAADFETAMKKLGRAAGGVSPDQLKALEVQAKSLGESLGIGAADAAEGMATLAKEGVSTGAILGGAFAASLKLAAIGQGELGTASAITGDLMRTFSIDAANLDPVLDKVTGALLAGHGGLDGYKQAVGEAGDAAVTAGISFRDFNTTVAALGAVLHKGAEAGGSLKEFLAKISEPSDIAKQEMKDLGASFLDASGKMKPMADIAETLKQRFAGLNDATRSKVFTEMFGASGMQTAIALMREGKQGFLDLQATIDKANGDTQAVKAQEGYAASVARLGAAFQNLKIEIGEAGLVDLFTSIMNGVTRAVHVLEGLAPMFYQIGAAATALSDALGPLLVIVGGALYLGFGFWLRSLGPIGWAISALIEPIGTLIAGLRVLAVQLVTMEGLGAAASAAFGLLLSPIVLVTAGLAALAYAWYSHNAAMAATAAEQQRLHGTMDGMKPAVDKVGEALAALTGKTGEAAKAARDHFDACVREAQGLLLVQEAGARQKERKALDAQAELATARGRLATAQRWGVIGSDDNYGARAALNTFYVQPKQDAATAAVGEWRAARDGIAAAKKQLADYQRQANQPTAKPINYTPPTGKKPKEGGDDKDYHGPTPEELQLQKEIEAAQLSGDLASARALQNRLDLSKQIRAYEKAGLTDAAARTRAERDMALVEAARKEAEDRAIFDRRQALDIGVAEAQHDYATETSLKRQQALRQDIMFYRGQEKTLAEATALAEADQAKRDAIAAAERKRWFEEDQEQRALHLAQLRGDTDEQIRQLQRIIDVRKRADDIEAKSNGTVSHVDALAQANREADQDHSAELQGKFRDIFKGGFKAAMDGDLGDWFKNWWKDKVAKGMEAAMNSLADLVAKLFSHVADGNGGGGFFGSLGKALGLVAGSGASNDLTGVSDPGNLVGNIDVLGSLGGDLHAFATGGSFTVGGKSGIDQNVVSFRATKGELVDIRRPGNDNGPGGGTTIHQTIQYSGVVDVADKTFVVQMAEAARLAAMSGIREADRRRG